MLNLALILAVLTPSAPSAGLYCCQSEVYSILTLRSTWYGVRLGSRLPLTDAFRLGSRPIPYSPPPIMPGFPTSYTLVGSVRLPAFGMHEMHADFREKRRVLGGRRRFISGKTEKNRAGCAGKSGHFVQAHSQYVQGLGSNRAV